MSSSMKESDDAMFCRLCNVGKPPRPTHEDFGQYAHTYFGFIPFMLCMVCGEECCSSCHESQMFVDLQHCPNPLCNGLLPRNKLERDRLMVKCAKTDELGSVKYSLAQSIMRNRLSGDLLQSIIASYSLFETLVFEASDLRYAPALISAGGIFLNNLKVRSSDDHIADSYESAKHENLMTSKDLFLRARSCFEQAQNQGHPSAESCLGDLYASQDYSKDIEIGLEYYESAASKGCSEAAYLAGIIYRDKWRETSSEWIKNSSWLYCKDQDKEASSYLLARAIEFFRQGVNSLRPDAQVCLSFALIDEAKMKYIDDEIPGKSPIPESRYWAYKALEYAPLNEYDTAIIETAEEFLRSSHERLKTRCAGCEHIDEDGFEFKCSRCKSAFYCSKVCQKRHWKAGHKVDCYDITSIVQVIDE